ncbi:MAG: MmcQ/YjbR family DNA-binding protein [Planctomycetota bacterium]
MVTVEEATRMAMDLPDVEAGTSYSNPCWMVGGKAFAWHRPFSKADLRRFGKDPVPAGPIFAVRVADLQTKAAVLEQGTRGVFTIPHFDNYAAVLVQLDVVPKRALRSLIADAWLACVPTATADRYRARPRKRRG